jgi:hypothetical protein
MTTRDDRVRELYSMTKVELAVLYKKESNWVWSAVPPEKWKKDQLVSDILELEGWWNVPDST